MIIVNNKNGNGIVLAVISLPLCLKRYCHGGMKRRFSLDIPWE